MRTPPAMLGRLALPLMAAAFASALCAQDDPPKRQRPAKVEVYAVVQVGQELRVVEKADVKALKKQLDDQYREDVKAHDARKKEARKAKEKFTEPRPAKVPLRVVKDGLKGEEAAQAFLKAEQARRDEAARKKAEKEAKKKGQG